ncbi:hypothetical protein [Qipengyuania spongiae]|uniref:Uncharacterized protein n=1 Tax=Qipengyuania spongiae TaxID=2909673 RepID=A0ABY5T4C3_9SPHN|nr:hypothetical protein [Qipengyuania spongiae]UVI39799.1 hypothetical protein L1F33_02210 [Qipengyuania spongiae]
MLSRSLLVMSGALAVPQTALAQNLDLDETDLVVRHGQTVDAVINDQPVSFHIAPEAISIPTVNGDAAQRIKLKPSIIGYGYLVGPVTVNFGTDTVRYLQRGGTFRRRTAFSDQQVVEGADAIAGPAAFPSRRTILTLRDPSPDDRALVFPMDRDMGRSQTGVMLDVDGHPVHVAFSFDRPESLVSATGGRWIADAHGGSFADGPRDTMVLYGVLRPARPLALTRPLMLGELEVRNVMVRISDLGNAEGIADSPPETAPAVDPDEIVVTAQSKVKPRSQRMYVGMDTIGHCASITYDFEAETVTLMCPATPAMVTFPVPVS